MLTLNRWVSLNGKASTFGPERSNPALVYWEKLSFNLGCPVFNGYLKIYLNFYFFVVILVRCILSLIVVLVVLYPYNKWYEGIIHKHSCNILLLHLAGLNKPVLGIRLELWPDGTLNCNCLALLLTLVIFGVYAVFKWELHSQGPFINHEASLNSS